MTTVANPTGSPRANSRTCSICGSTAALRFHGQEGFQAGQWFDIFECPTCDASFCDPLASSAGLYDLVYERAPQIPGYDRYVGYAALAERSADPLADLARCEDVYWAVREVVLRLGTPAPRVLEVGSGLGYLTYALHEAGADVLGIDVSEEVISQARHRFGDLYRCVDARALSSELPRAYDLVIMTEVIEHVVAPLQLLSELKALLSPGGRILLTTPDKSVCPRALVWDTDPPPIHLWWLSHRTVSCLAVRLEMDLEILSFSPMNGGRQYPPVTTKPPTLDPSGDVRVTEGLARRAIRLLTRHAPRTRRALASVRTRQLVRRRSRRDWSAQSLSLCALFRARDFTA